MIAAEVKERGFGVWEDWVNWYLGHKIDMVWSVVIVVCFYHVYVLFSLAHYRFRISYFIFKGKDVTMSHRFFIACMQYYISRYASILPFKSIMPWTSMDPVCFGADFWLAHWHLVAVNPVRTSTPSCISLTCLSSAGIPEKCCQLTLKCASSTLDQSPSRMKQHTPGSLWICG